MHLFWTRSLLELLVLGTNGGHGTGRTRSFPHKTRLRSGCALGSPEASVVCGSLHTFRAFLCVSAHSGRPSTRQSPAGQDPDVRSRGSSTRTSVRPKLSSKTFIQSGPLFETFISLSLSSKQDLCSRCLSIKTFVHPRSPSTIFLHPRHASKTSLRPRPASKTFLRPRPPAKTFVLLWLSPRSLTPVRTSEARRPSLFFRP